MSAGSYRYQNGGTDDKHNPIGLSSRCCNNDVPEKFQKKTGCDPVLVYYTNQKSKASF
jgi:hypothetical protein